MDKIDYDIKVNNIINDGVQAGKYIETEDNTHSELHNFQQFLYRNFKNHK